MLDLLASTNTAVGLHENVIFDIVGEVEDAVTGGVHQLSTEISINATAFHVTCGLQAHQNGTQANTPTWDIFTPLADESLPSDPAPVRLLSKTDTNTMLPCLTIPQHATVFDLCKEILRRPGQNDLTSPT